MRFRRSLLAFLFALAMIFASLPVLLAPQTAEAAVVYSIVVSRAQNDAYTTYATSDTPAGDEVLIYTRPDVSGRGTGSGNAVTIDVYIFGDTNLTWRGTATVTGTGTFYATSYVGASGWFCEEVLNDEQHCAMKIDDDTNAWISLRGRENAAYECASADHITNPSQPPTEGPRSVQGDLYKHTDPSKSATTHLDYYMTCVDGNEFWIPQSYKTHDRLLFYNGSSPARMKPTATAVKFAAYQIHDFDTGVTSLTYDYVVDLPSNITPTSCVISGTFPHATPTCTITSGAGGKYTFSVVEGGNTSNSGWIDLYGTITAPAGCPYSGVQSKPVFDDEYITRHFDGAWNDWGALNVDFGCS